MRAVHYESKSAERLEKRRPYVGGLLHPVLWLAALLASGYEDGMTVFALMGRFSELLEWPFAIRWTPYTLKFMAAGAPGLSLRHRLVLLQPSEQAAR